jgi:hypothetical protein
MISKTAIEKLQSLERRQRNWGSKRWVVISRVNGKARSKCALVCVCACMHVFACVCR